MFLTNSTLRKPRARPLVKWRLHVDDEVFALGPLLLAGARLERFGLVDVPVLAVDLVAGQKGGGQAHASWP